MCVGFMETVGTFGTRPSAESVSNDEVPHHPRWVSDCMVGCSGGAGVAGSGGAGWGGV